VVLVYKEKQKLEVHIIIIQPGGESSVQGLLLIGGPQVSSFLSFWLGFPHSMLNIHR
jgi:hypothetical protein